MHPQAIIMDDSKKEETYFVRAMRFKAEDLGKPLIEIPSGKYENWLWIKRLAAASLVHWHKPTIDIVIQAPTESSGSLIRLLQSLTNADYRGLKMPRVTIELPAKIEWYNMKTRNWFASKNIYISFLAKAFEQHFAPASFVLFPFPQSLTYFVSTAR